MKTVSISLSPNTEKDDLKIAFKELFSRKKIKGKHLKTFENNFKNYFDFKSVFSLNSGRSSLFLILKSLDIKKGDEVIVQAFTCNAVVNPISVSYTHLDVYKRQALGQPNNRLDRLSLIHI